MFHCQQKLMKEKIHMGMENIYILFLSIDLINVCFVTLFLGRIKALGLKGAMFVG